MGRRIGVICRLAVALSVPLATAWAVDATLRPLKGSVYLRHANQPTWTLVKAQTSVVEGDQVRTNNASLAFLVLPDDHRVAISEETHVVLQRMADGETKLYLKNGAVRSKVQHLKPDLGQYYKVQTPTAVCAVRGTDFSVVQHLESKSAQVRVFEGFVDFGALRKELGGTSTHLEAGQSAMLDAAGKLQETRAPHSDQPAPQGDPKRKEKSDDAGDGTKRPVPPGPGGATAVPGGNWHEHPETIDNRIFNPAGERLPFQDPSAPLPLQPDNDPSAAQKQPVEGEQRPWTSTSFNPLTGTPYEQPPVADDPSKISGPTNIYSPPPSGDTTVSGSSLDPRTAGTQALYNTIEAQNLHSQLQGLLVADLFRDGGVRLSPIDGQWHLYADGVQQNGPDGVKFYNATMMYNQPGSLNYQIAAIKFNQPLPLLPSAFNIATQTAFRSDFGAAPPAYFATDFDNLRWHGGDYVRVTGAGGGAFYDATVNRYFTKYADTQATVNGTQLYHATGAGITYFGGAAPVTTYSNSGIADASIINTYGTTATGQITFGRRVTYFNDAGQIANSGNIPSGLQPLDYFAGTTLTAQDMLFSNLFTRGPMVAFGSAQSRLLGGIDSIVNQNDARDILNGKLVVGVPDGLLRL
jgi:hypothetical protein